MLVCSHCAHENPVSAFRCEACFSVLPMLTHCFNCGAEIPTEAKFCGQCGTALRSGTLPVRQGDVRVESGGLPQLERHDPAHYDLDRHAAVMVIQDLVAPHPLVMLDSIALDSLPTAALPDTMADLLHNQISPNSLETDYLNHSATSFSAASAIPSMLLAVPESPINPLDESLTGESRTNASLLREFYSPEQEVLSGTKTHLQERAVYFVHLPSNTAIEIPGGLPVIHLGKPNERIPPDIDLAGFPHSEVVSRIHADIRVEGDAFFLEDVGSANGTYVNNLPLLPGNRHRLRVGDRIAFGKGNLVTFLFQLI